ncbi:hypothetical protein DK427_01440 [Methylobacterium radiodurans]|uniref:Glycosyl transferase family 28 C-terminal domain-containing protein n=1 Tax=Methylobacterium radiodurans TaxID=2202828 RepID=A0A2U8VYB9_9HYPH|nr:hypothetical protein DK427_01440 [Methylobacterium radiodurans]
MASRPSPVGLTPERPCRVLIYSHDTFGLGHLRRARTIAAAIVQGGVAQAVIVSGSPVLDRFAPTPGVSTVAVPPVTKRPDGAYASLDPAIPLEETVAARRAIILRTFDAFRPHLVLVDKEPAGFHGEMLPVLERAAERGCRPVLGLRDVLDDPAWLAAEWARKGAGAVLERFYDEVWVYGVPRLHRPLAGLGLVPEVEERLIYTGYLRRALPRPDPARREPALADGPFLLVTPGGGGDGAALIDWVIAAYETDPGIPLPALVAFGPFLDASVRADFLARIGRLPGRLAAITFDAQIEFLIGKAAGVVAMGGYNTFCEILSFDRPALLVPRTEPRREQEIRARSAETLGLVRVLAQAGGRTPERMAAALRTLPDQPPPSRVVLPGLLDGLGVVADRVRALSAGRPLSVAEAL